MINIHYTVLYRFHPAEDCMVTVDTSACLLVSPYQDSLIRTPSKLSLLFPLQLPCHPTMNNQDHRAIYGNHILLSYVWQKDFESKN